MVKVGIIGADSKQSGELIRILVLHPETELTTLYAPELTGRNLSYAHHGLIGENNLLFTDKINLEESDFIVLPDNSDLTEKIITQINNYENLKLVITGSDNLTLNGAKANIQIETGISEANRKALVRGARVAYIPSPAVVPALVALSPLATFLLLNSDINISVVLPADIYSGINVDKDIQELKSLIQTKQTSFNENINLKINGSDNKRGAVTEILLKNNLPISEIEKIYDQIYDDHNFTFISRSDISTKEVEGTQKILIYLEKPSSDSLKIKIVSDPRMRGGAGDVVHTMNLFFGLHEKTGLHFKSSAY